LGFPKEKNSKKKLAPRGGRGYQKQTKTEKTTLFLEGLGRVSKRKKKGETTKHKQGRQRHQPDSVQMEAGTFQHTSKCREGWGNAE